MRKPHQPFDPRQYMFRPDFEVFHHKDSQPPDVGLHHHDFYEVYLFLNGNVDYQVEGSIYHLQPGDLLLISPMELHRLIINESNSVYDRFVLWINRDFLSQFSDEQASLTRCFDASQRGHSNLLRLSSAQRIDLATKLDLLMQECSGNNYAQELCAKGVFLQFMVSLNRIALRKAGSPAVSEESSTLVHHVLAYISTHYNEDLSLEGIAQQFYVSKYHLSHEFSRLVGTSVYRYITMKRLLIAKQMLANGVSPGVAYMNCGFTDYANFYRAFKAQYGISPRESIGKA